MAGIIHVTRLPGPLFQSFKLSRDHQRSGRASEAAEIYRRILQSEPNHAESLYQLGVIAAQTGRLDEAIQRLRHAVALEPRSTEYLRGLGAAFEAMGRIEDAIPPYREASRLDPKDVSTLAALGGALARSGRLVEAWTCFRALQSRQPNAASSYGPLGNVLLGLGRVAEAEGAFRRACELDRRSGASHADLAIALHALGRLAEAETAARMAVSLQPDLPAAHHALGNVLAGLGHATEAVTAYEQALKLRPSAPMTAHNLGNVLSSVGRAAEADHWYRRTLRAAPGFAMAHSSLLLNLNYLPDRSTPDIAAEHRRWETVHARAGNVPCPPDIQDASAARRLRIGYVSGDFRHHPVGHFFEPLLDHHDRAEFEIFCYARIGVPDDLTDRIRQRADHFVSIIGMSEAEVAERIRTDRIDILIDLAGHTNGDQMLLFARKPAPIQASWLGYPHGTGLSAIDYRISDAIADPDDPSSASADRSIERLDHGFLCYRAPENAPPAMPPPVLRNGYITFGSFNNLAKLNDATLARWAAILRGTPASRLLLKAKPLTDAGVRSFFRDALSRHGVGADRVDFRAATASIADHLDLYREIDIALDPDPYNGTTTSCEALWMGVPIVTLKGDRHASRVGASLLARLDLSELAAEDSDRYIATALDLGRDIDRLERLRATLRERMRASPLMDAPGFAKEMEQAYRHMWRRYCQSLSALQS